MNTPTTPPIDDMAVAEIINAHGDPEAFAQRQLVVVRDIQKLPIGTTLHARLPYQESYPEMWTKLRQSLMAVVLEGAQAEIDEVDAQLLLGLLDSHGIAPTINPQLERVIGVLETGIGTLKSMQDNMLRKALLTIVESVSTERPEESIRRVVEVARVALGKG